MRGPLGRHIRRRRNALRMAEILQAYTRLNLTFAHAQRTLAWSRKADGSGRRPGGRYAGRSGPSASFQDVRCMNLRPVTEAALQGGNSISVI